MGKPSFTDIVGLISNIVFPFHELKRDMDLALEVRRKESDTEHTWTVALVSCALAAQVDKDLDIGKTAQLAIVHDLVEIYAGDTSIWDTEGLKDKEERERLALETIKEKTSAFPWIVQTIEDYEKKESPEARFVWAVDKLTALGVRYMDLSNGGDYFKNYIPKTADEFREGIQPTKEKAYAHPEIGPLFDAAVEAITDHPEWFKATK